MGVVAAREVITCMPRLTNLDGLNDEMKRMSQELKKEKLAQEKQRLEMERQAKIAAYEEKMTKLAEEKENAGAM